MLEVHVTREGDQMLIAEMADSHLCNMINMVIRKAQEIKDQAGATSEMTEFDRALYGVTDVTPSDAATVTKEVLRKLYPYLAEAYLRGLDAPHDALVALVGRDQAIAVSQRHLPIPERVRYLGPDFDEPEF